MNNNNNVQNGFIQAYGYIRKIQQLSWAHLESVSQPQVQNQTAPSEQHRLQDPSPKHGSLIHRPRLREFVFRQTCPNHIYKLSSATPTYTTHQSFVFL